MRFLLEEDGSNNYFQPLLKGSNLLIFFILSWLFLTYFIIEFAVNPVLGRFG